MRTARKPMRLPPQFSRVEPEMGMPALARRLDRANVRRLLRTLLTGRLVAQHRVTRRDRLGEGGRRRGRGPHQPAWAADGRCGVSGIMA